MLDFKKFNEDSMNHLRITQCFVNYFVSLGLIVENIKTNDNEIIIYTSTPKDTICEKAFREKEHDLCDMFLAQKCPFLVLDLCHVAFCFLYLESQSVDECIDIVLQNYHNIVP